eukprot:529777-Prymnesium_polylepis.1
MGHRAFLRVRHHSAAARPARLPPPPVRVLHVMALDARASAEYRFVFLQVRGSPLTSSIQLQEVRLFATQPGSDSSFFLLDPAPLDIERAKNPGGEAPNSQQAAARAIDGDTHTRGSKWVDLGMGRSNSSTLVLHLREPLL